MKPGGFGLLVELHREGSAPVACAAGLFYSIMSLMKLDSFPPEAFLHWSLNRADENYFFVPATEFLQTCIDPNSCRAFHIPLHLEEKSN